MGRLDGKIAIVTGAAEGVGRACALALAAEGATLMINDLGTNEEGEGSSSGPAEAMADTINSAGGRASWNGSTMAEKSGVDALIDQTLEEFGAVDIAVACAGAGTPGSILDQSEDGFWFQLHVQLAQKWWLSRRLAPLMVDRGWGRLVLTTSHGATGELGQPAFATSMAGVIGLARAAANELQGTGVTVNCLAPGAATRQHAKLHDEFQAWHEAGVIDDEMWESYVLTPPPEFVPPIVAWLCSSAGDGVTGKVFSAMGGNVGVWAEAGDKIERSKGDHREVPPWTLEELDEVVPQLLAES